VEEKGKKANKNKGREEKEANEWENKAKGQLE
jgi:hypothetical protein